MTIKTETRIVDIKLRIWYDNVGYGPDCFDSLEPNFPCEFPERADDDYNSIIATDEAVNDLIKWWQTQCDTANSGEYHEEGLDVLKDGEWDLTVDEIDG